MLKFKKPKSQSNTACICLWPCFILVPGAKPCTKFLTYTLDPHSLPKLHPGMAVCLLKPLFKFRSTFEAWNRNVGGENDDDDITEGVSVCTSQVQPKGTDHGTSISNASAPYIRIYVKVFAVSAFLPACLWWGLHQVKEFDMYWFDQDDQEIPWTKWPLIFWARGSSISSWRGGPGPRDPNRYKQQKQFHSTGWCIRLHTSREEVQNWGPSF